MLEERRQVEEVTAFNDDSSGLEQLCGEKLQLANSAK